MNHNAPAHPLAADEEYTGLMGLASLLRLSLSGADISPLGQKLLERAQANPDDANSLMDLSTVLQFMGDRELALSMQAEALRMQQLYRLPATGGTPAIRLLAIMGPGDLMANTPLECLVEDSDVDLSMLYLAPNLPLSQTVPDHDVLIVAVGESDDNRPILKMVEEFIKDWPRPALNTPERIAHLSRDNAYALLQDVPGIIMPASARIDRQSLEQVAAGEQPIAAWLDNGLFPIIIRPVGSHAGQGLLKLYEPGAITDYLKMTPDNEFYISHFVDYRAGDGRFRKYRIALINGRPFACHMAISDHWIIHYLNAGMTESEEKRAEEERFMTEFDAAFARRHAQALAAITERVGLDYVGIDCAETLDGQLLIFEIDNAMVVHAMDPVDLFPYKQPQMKKVFGAFRRMLIDAKNRMGRNS
ncbi:MAG TPA: RimK family alpha-L-glutamate ligase [Gammaproteobacteria bacterium]|nr:RimK family alpha-L-glutamate ligase [Gammaproteobacteria bacterium]